MKRLIPTALAGLLIAVAAPAMASGKHDHDHGKPKAASEASKSTEMAEAEVRKVDKEQGKITLKHGEIKSLDMPAMTMVFRVKDAALLDKVVAGDKIKFQAEKINGAFTVTHAEKMK
ncbi:MAG: copper-binding protein [Betaproteobacteria bacterium]|nr:copper-binding protein [Betaproteobacteria bacterium]